MANSERRINSDGPKNRENKRFPGKQKLKGLAGITLALQKIL